MALPEIDLTPYLRLPFALADMTVLLSAEPSAMGVGAGGGRVDSGLSMARLKEITRSHPQNPTPDLPCRDVFAAGQWPTVVVGPLMVDEAAEIHRRFWSAR